MTMLFDALRARGLTEFINFLHVLQETSHGWLADDVFELKVANNNADKLSPGEKVSLKEFAKDHEENMEQNSENDARRYPIPVGYLMYPGIPIVYADPRPLYDREESREYAEPVSGPVHMYTHRHPRRKIPTFVNQGDVFHNGYANPPLENAAKQLKSLKEVYERESLYTDQSMTLLKQEELAIRTLLQNNVQEQQLLLGKKEAISDLENRMIELNARASRLHTEPTAALSRARLRHLQRVPFRYTHAYTKDGKENDDKP